MSPARALRLGLARAAAHLLDLPLQVTDLAMTDVSLDALAGVLPDDMLLALLDGPEGARGAIGLDRAIVAALIEVQTMGAVSTLPVAERRLTPTDAAMVAPWLDAALERVDLSLDKAAPAVGGKDAGWMVGYRFGAMAEEPRALALALDSPDFHMMRLSLDVALGRRKGEMVLLLPAARPPETQDDSTSPPSQETFLAVSAELQVIAGRFSLPLDKASALRPGDVLPLDSLLTAAELRAVDGSLAGKARLGRMGDHWAVRLGSAASPAPEAEDPAALTAPEMPRAEPPTDVPPVAPPAAELPDLPPFDPPSEPLPDLPPLDFDTGGDGFGPDTGKGGIG